MKNKITRHNYEAFFIDYSEGNISDEDSALLMQFLDANPDLKEELDAFEAVTLSPAKGVEESMDWSSLKMPVSGESANRDLLYFKAVEGTLSGNDEVALTALLANAEYKKEFDLWQKLKLAADRGIAFPKDGLFRFGYEMELNEFTFEHYLIARCEGLLMNIQNTRLEQFAARTPDGALQLALADKLRLQPARAIFFPDKEKLYKKEKGIALVMWYRIAGVAAALLLAFALWTWYNVNPTDTHMAGDKIKSRRNSEKVISTPAINADSTEKANKSLIPAKETPLEEWQMREPDELEIASTPKPAPAAAPKQTPEINRLHTPAPAQYHEIPEEQLAEATVPISENTTEPISEEVAIGESATLSTSGSMSNFKTLSEIAEEKLTQKLALTEEERDALALTVAKRAAERAGSFLNTEFTKEKTVDNRGENLTYTLRVGSFKASHSKTR